MAGSVAKSTALLLTVPFWPILAMGALGMALAMDAKDFASEVRRDGVGKVLERMGRARQTRQAMRQQGVEF